MPTLIQIGTLSAVSWRLVAASVTLPLFAVVVFIVTTVCITYLRLDGWHLFAVKHYLVANVLTFFDSTAKQRMILPNSYSNSFAERIVLSSEVTKEPQIMKAVYETGNILALSTLYGTLSSIGAAFFIFIYLRRRGKRQSEAKQLRGYAITNEKNIKKLIKKNNRSDITIASLCLPKDFETGHILIHGTTGMGKSVCIKELLDQIRKRGDRVIIYDQGCDYISSFYTEGDVILNPLDQRTASWSLWNECRDSADYDSLAAALIPSPPNANEPFWSNGARVIFSAMARQLAGVQNKSITLLLESILNVELSEMESILKGTEAAALVSEKVEKTSLSFKTMLATYLKPLKYIKDEENPFSIRKWIQDDSKKNWLFISSLADRHETLKPLISMWLDLAANSLMSLTPSYTRRIWLIFDELASLYKLPYLPNAFAQSRKFGGCLVAGVQSIAQLRKVYGQHAADEISTMCNTRIFFRSPSSEAAVWTSKELGQHEVEEMKEGISYSESAMRSGISINKHIVQKDLVSAPEIMQLQPLEAYVRLPGDLPVARIKLEYIERATIACSFIARKIEETTPITKKTTKKYSLLIFDWDGTLVDSLGLHTKALQKTALDFNCPIPEVTVIHEYFGHDTKSMLRHFFPQKDLPELTAKYYNYFTEEYLAKSLFPGTLETLDFLKQHGFVLAIVTNAPRAKLDKALDIANMHALFAATRCPEDAIPKPAPDMLLSLLNELNVVAQDALMVGDTAFDMQAAKNAGVDAIAVCYGHNRKEQLIAHNPIGFIEDIKELKDILIK